MYSGLKLLLLVDLIHLWKNDSTNHWNRRKFENKNIKKNCSTKHVSDLCGVAGKQSVLPQGAALSVQQAAQFVFIYTAPLPTALPAACTPLHTHVTVCMLQAEYDTIFSLIKFSIKDDMELSSENNSRIHWLPL